MKNTCEGTSLFSALYFNAQDTCQKVRHRLEKQTEFLAPIVFAPGDTNMAAKEKLLQHYLDARLALDDLENCFAKQMRSDCIASFVNLSWSLFLPVLSPFNSHNLTIRGKENGIEVDSILLPIMLELYNMAFQSISWGGSISCRLTRNEELQIIMVSALSTEQLDWGEMVDDKSVVSVSCRIANAVEAILGGIMTTEQNRKENNEEWVNRWCLSFHRE